MKVRVTFQTTSEIREWLRRESEERLLTVSSLLNQILIKEKVSEENEKNN